jgi:hypothetical protein
VGVLTLVILVLGALVLSVRSFTVLTALIHSLGSEVIQQHQETQQVLTTSLTEMERNIQSAQPDDTPTTRVKGS